MDKPKVERQGKVVVEPDGGAFMVMFPDGTVRGFATRERVEAAAKCWFKTHVPAGAIGVGEIEWR